MSFTPIRETTLTLFETARPSTGVAKPVSQEQFWGEEGVSFESFLDTINPFQQLPVVSTVYRAVTGDTISTGARLAGGAIFGGPLGFASALLNVIVEGETGKDIGANVMSALEGGETPTPSLASTVLANGNTGQSPATRAAYLAYSNAMKLG